MAIPAGNSRVICVGKQVAKGTPLAAPTAWYPLSADQVLSPNRDIITLPETDASAQRADSRVVGASPGGGWTGWWRNTGADLLCEAIMGAVGAGVYTPDQDLPYYTIWDVIPSYQTTRYDDCRFSELTISGQAGQGIQYQVGSVVALSATLGVTEPASLTLPTDAAYTYPSVAVSVGGSHPGTHDQFEITINRNVGLLRGDNGLAALDSVPGLFEVTGRLLRWYQTDADFREVEGGAAGATTLTTTIFEEALSIAIDDGTNSTTIDSTNIEYTDYSNQVNLDGTPMLQTLGFQTVREAAIADNLTITLA